ncbi:hypothetical protein ACIOEX_10565 [Streptomyces sp. NPDC087850]|uniref:hypothetical protein n=1 Tax=Streptomyces sp. NPDC087850 TaxID=3365809 RepID=UPI0037F6E5FA
MAEISYPFDSDSSGGGTAVVSQTQWQQMAAAWGGDRIDFELSNATYSGTALPFSPSVINGRQIVVAPGKAWVGGFYYQNTSPITFNIPANGTTLGRKDALVIRVNLATGSANIALVTGIAAAKPVEPRPVRQIGGVWEMPLHSIDVPANNGGLTVSRRAPFKMPPAVSYPWLAADSAAVLPKNAVYFDVDSNASGGPAEYWNGIDGNIPTRHLGKSQTYTPAMVNSSAIAAANRTGRWRYIAPNMVWFSLRVINTLNSDVKLTSSWAIGVTLPVPASGKTGQILSGHMDNQTSVAGGLPNYVDLTAKVNQGGNSTSMVLYYPNSNNPAEGLDGLRAIPRKSFITISGIYEAGLLD